MEEVDVIAAQAQFDGIIEKVANGATIVVTREGKAIARFRRPSAEEDTTHDVIAIVEPV